VGGVVGADRTHYPRLVTDGTVGLAIMLRTYFCSSGSTCRPGMEEAFYDSLALRRFAGVDLGMAAAPTRPRFFASAACWSSTNCAARFWTR